MKDTRDERPSINDGFPRRQPSGVLRGNSFGACRSGKVPVAVSLICGIVAVVVVLSIVAIGVTSITTPRTFSNGAVQIDLPVAMWDSPKKPPGCVLLCEDKLSGVAIAAYTLPDNDPSNLSKLASKVTRGGAVSFGGSQISFSGFPKRLQISGKDAYQVSMSGNINGQNASGTVAFLHVANKNYAIVTACPSKSFRRHKTEMKNLVKTVRPAGSSVSETTPEQTVSTGAASAAPTAPSKPHVAAQFDSVSMAINVLKNNGLATSANQETNRCETDKGWRASAVAYLVNQPVSESQQQRVIECIDTIVQSQETFLERNEFYEALVRSKWELPDSLMLELANRLLQGNNQVALHMIDDQLVAWIKRERPESLARAVIDAAIKRTRHGKDLLEVYPEEATLGIFEEKMRGTTSSFWLKDLEKLVGKPDFSAAQEILMSVLDDADDENDKIVMEYLADESPANASSDLHSRVSWLLASRTLDFSDDEGDLAKLVRNWMLEEHHGLLVDSLHLAKSYDRSKLLPVVMSLGTDLAYEGVIDSIEEHGSVRSYADSLPDSESQRERFELLLIKSCDIADPGRVGTCCELLAQFGGPSSVVAISNARDWAYDNDEFHLRVAADRALDAMATRIDIDEALRNRNQYLAKLRPLRTWTSGKFEVEARLVRVDGDYVVLEKEDKSKIRVETTRLCEGDQRYVKQQSRKTK